MGLFCQHIYKIRDAEYAYTTILDNGSVIFPATAWVKVDVYIAKRECLKCGKIKKTEEYVRSTGD